MSQTQKGLTQIYKDSLKSYNTNFDIESEGSYWDITANATAGVAKAVLVEAQEIVNAATPQDANSQLLDKWLIDVGAVPRLSGEKASGLVSVIVASSQEISSDDTFTKDGLVYKPVTNFTVVGTQNITVQAVGTGAEYGIPAGGDFVYSGSATISSATSLGIYNGQSAETDSQVLSRIELFMQNRKDSCTLVFYEQKGLELFSYCQASLVRVSNVIIKGTLIEVGNAIENYDIAKKKVTINDISIDGNAITAAKEYFLKWSGVYGSIEVASLSTQVISGIEIEVVNDKGTLELTVAEINEVKESVRLAILTFSGDVVSKVTLKPELPSYIVNYVFEDALLIPKTSKQMDILLNNISVKLGTFTV